MDTADSKRAAKQLISILGRIEAALPRGGTPKRALAEMANIALSHCLEILSDRRFYSFQKLSAGKGEWRGTAERRPLSDEDRELCAWADAVENWLRPIIDCGPISPDHSPPPALAESLAEPVDATAKPDHGPASKESRAIAVLMDHPDWTHTRVAKEARCNRTALYKMEKYTAARRMLKSGRDDIPHGSKDDETGDVEAWDNSTDDE